MTTGRFPLTSRHAVALSLFSVAAAYFVIPEAQASPLTLQQFQDDLSHSYNSSAPVSADTKLLVFLPPLQVDPQLSDRDPIVQTLAIAVLADQVPLPKVAYANSGRSTYSVYKTILDNRALEPSAVDEQDARALKAAEYVLLRHQCWLSRFFSPKSLTREPSRKLQQYRKYESHYAVLETQLQRATDNDTRTALLSKEQETLRQWEAKGYKKQVQKALGDFESIQARNPATFWATVDDQFHMNVRSISGKLVPMTTFDPMASAWDQSAGWTAWSSGTSAAQLKTVAIERPWLNLDVLAKRAWKWQEGTLKKEKVTISGGQGLNTVGTTSELMPLLPIAVILAKNVYSQDGVEIQHDPVIAGLLCRVLPALPPE